jgi:ketosteroid isomerase-like protein
MDAATEIRLLELLDRQDIADCLHRYARGMDRFDKELLLSAYHPDAVDDHGSFLGSPAEFWDHFQALHSQHNRGHHHSLSNITIELDGACAHTETYYLFESINADGSMTLHGGRYIDRFEKRGGDWKIAARACIVEWHGKLNEVHYQPAFVAAMAASGVGTRDKSDRSYERPLTVRSEPSTPATTLR